MVPINSTFTGKILKLPSTWTSKTPKRHKRNTINDDLYNSKKKKILYFDEEIRVKKREVCKG